VPINEQHFSDRRGSHLDAASRALFYALRPMIKQIKFVIIDAIQASDGKFYRYPTTIRFIQ
jgi:uncharacterized Tic20 family protein